MDGVQVTSDSYRGYILYVEDITSGTDGKSDYLLNEGTPVPHMPSVREHNAASLHAGHLAFMLLLLR